MNGAGPHRGAQVLWAMLLTAAAAFLFMAAYNYMTCRADSFGKLGCLIAAVLVTGLEAIVLIVVTVFKLLRLVLP